VYIYKRDGKTTHSPCVRFALELLLFEYPKSTEIRRILQRGLLGSAMNCESAQENVTLKFFQRFNRQVENNSGAA